MLVGKPGPAMGATLRRAIAGSSGAKWFLRDAAQHYIVDMGIAIREGILDKTLPTKYAMR